MVNSEEKKGKAGGSFEQFMRTTFKVVLDPIASFLLKLGLTPNMVTVSGLLLSSGVAVLIGFGHITWAGILLLIAAPMDAIDGSMARLKDSVTIFGAFLIQLWTDTLN
jgi:CDP-diacylglycerol--glycerol-3-phosphate 3-phosphatidyltransferase